MSGLNKVMLIGRLGKDPEVRHTSGGNPVATFGLATSESWRDKSGEKQDRTEWHNVVVWGKLAEIAQKFLVRGAQVYVEGRLQTRDWTDREGQKRKTTEVIAEKMTMLERKRDSGGNPNYADADSDISYSGDSDIPF